MYVLGTPAAPTGGPLPPDNPTTPKPTAPPDDRPRTAPPAPRTARPRRRPTADDAAPTDHAHDHGAARATRAVASRVACGRAGAGTPGDHGMTTSRSAAGPEHRASGARVRRSSASSRSRSLGAIALRAALLMSTDNDDVTAARAARPTAGPAPTATRFDDPQGDVLARRRPAAGSVATPRRRRERRDVVHVRRARPDVRDDVDDRRRSTVGELDLDQYLQLVIDQAPEVGRRLQAARVPRGDDRPTDVEADAPTQLGVVAYEGRATATRRRATSSSSSVEAGDARSSRRSTTDTGSTSTTYAPQVEPYLMTLRPT